MSLTRRSFLAAGASAVALPTLGSLAGCATAPAAPAVTTIAPGIARVTVGSYTVTSMPDGFVDRPLAEGFVRNATLAQVQAALAEAGLPTDKVTVPFTPFVVDTGKNKVLLDGGNGTFGAPTSGTLLKSLAAAGLQPSQIDTIIVSHFHGDHINGLRNKDGALTFPNAKILVPAPEWAWWMDDARMNALPENQRGNFMAVRRVFGPIAQNVERFEPGRELVPGIRSMPAFGHTAGHTTFMVENGGQKLLYWADTTNVAALFVRNPDWAVMFDADAEAARKVRRALMEMAVKENLLVAGYHLTLPAIGRLSPRGSGYDFKPVV
ncbi:MAG: MBL fold metallo-hydrolase [Burkholderiaceae bacterium]|jgi:glyoxylase-like metal-dependent hydrolase (beta-lactamase superfamily II)|nr:MBL fold metallo-hydrolase [Burkholderiaceae bacterium]